MRPLLPGTTVTAIKCKNCGAMTPVEARCRLCGTTLTMESDEREAKATDNRLLEAYDDEG